MVRILLALSIAALPLAARAQADDGRWGEGAWSGDDEYSDPDARPSDPRDGYARDADREFDRDRDRPPDWVEGDRYQAAGPSMDDFRSGLDSYGRWVDTPEYGMVWQPTRVAYSWHPYWDGRWMWTNAGWTWVSDEPWGWATYHYGRWAYLSGPGWVWLPGRIWAPAWVAWRYGDGFAGWCPLGPHGVVIEQPRYWVFVESRSFLEPVRHNTVPIAQVSFGRIRPLPIARPGPRAGPPPRVIETQTRIPVRAVPIVDAQTRVHPRVLPSGAVPMYRPRTVPLVPVQRYGAVPARSAAPAARPPSNESSRSSGTPHARPADGSKR